MRFFLIIVLLALSGCAKFPYTVSEAVNGDIVWEGTVQIDGDVIVEKGSVLTIRPGTTVLFLTPSETTDRFTTHPHFNGSELIIRGEIHAEGTPTSPILFRHIDTSAPAGSWGGINIMGAKNALFRYCRFIQADSALHAQETRVLIEECLFERNLVAIRFHTTEMTIVRNLIRHNGTGIRFHFGSPEIVSNDIHDNGKNIFVTSYPRNYRISENNVTGYHDYNVVLGEEVPDTFVMKGNFWGNKDPRQITASLFDGRVDTDLGHIEFEPYSSHPFPEAGISWTP